MGVGEAPPDRFGLVSLIDSGASQTIYGGQEAKLLVVIYSKANINA